MRVTFSPLFSLWKLIETQKKKKENMAGRKDGGPFIRNNTVHSLRGSRIAAAIVTGVLVGCVFAFLFPHGLFSGNPPTIYNHQMAKSNAQVPLPFYLPM